MTTKPAPLTLPCPFWRRLAALVYDLLAVLAMVMMAGYACQLATGGRLVSGDGHAIAWWYQPLQALVVSAYFLASWLRGGQTLGMRPWRLRVVGANGVPLRPAQALLRLLVGGAPLLGLWLAPWLGVATAGWAVLGGWIVLFGTALFDPRQRALHDIAARSELRRIG